MSLATLLSQRRQVVAKDVLPEKVTCVSQGRSPIQDAEILRFAERTLNLTATLDAEEAFSGAEFAVITNRYDLPG